MQRNKSSFWQGATLVFGITTIALGLYMFKTPTKPVEPALRGLSERYQHTGERLTLVLSTHFDVMQKAIASVAALRLQMPVWVVHELLLVVPYAESLVLPPLLSPPNGYTMTWPIRVIPEHEVLGVARTDLEAMPDSSSPIFRHRLQMLTKLFAARQVNTSFYLALDSDAIQTQPIQSIRWLLPEPGRAVYMPEPRSLHSRRWADTEALLKLSGCLATEPDIPTFGVTPAVLSKNIAEKSVAHILQVLGDDQPATWLKPLLSTDPQAPRWTDYAAYRLTACRHDLFNTYHTLGLEGNPRLYSRTPHSASANSTIRASDSTIFMVVPERAHLSLSKVLQDLQDVFKSYLL